MGFHILQISISCLIPLIYLSYILQKYSYVYILLGNLLISLYVHRKDRLETIEIEDKIDSVFITIWIVKNLYEIGLIIFTTKNIFYTCYIVFVALLNVNNCCYLNRLRLNYSWRSRENIEYHIKMHLSATLGTYVLIYNL